MTMIRHSYYNEIDPYAAQWIRNLIRAGQVPQGDVDERSIADVSPEDLKGYAQCHFFAGIAGWSFALKIAGWPKEAPVWTGSCPCQPFSSAGKMHALADERHLWPKWFSLIAKCCPPTIFGEQVDAAIRHKWLDLVFDDLEGKDYACGAFVLPACSVGAPHLRKRLWFVADTCSAGWQRFENQRGSLRSIYGEGLAVTNDPLTQARHFLEGNYQSILPNDGLSAKLGQRAIRGYGNAIVPQVAAEFVRAYMECRP